MPSYKLIYFSFTKGRAEMTRILFAAAGVKYEDCRLSKEEFQELKASGKLPFDKLPVLEVDGKTISQSTNILKYVARETGFAPTESFEIAKADMIVDGLEALMEKCIKFFIEKDEELKEKLKKEFYEEHLPFALGKCEALLKSNGEKFFADNKLTYADIHFFACLDLLFPAMAEKAPSILDNYPCLKDLCERIRNNPGVMKWLKERPLQ